MNNQTLESIFNPETPVTRAAKEFIAAAKKQIENDYIVETCLLWFDFLCQREEAYDFEDFSFEARHIPLERARLKTVFDQFTTIFHKGGLLIRNEGMYEPNYIAAPHFRGIPRDFFPIEKETKQYE